MSGGGTVYHDGQREFVYGITAPEDLYPRDVVGAYEEVLGMVRSGLERLGVETWVKDDNNILSGDLKVSGNSQRRSRGVLQVHGTVLWDVDEEAMFSVLKARPGQAEGGGKATPSVHHPVTGLRSLAGVPYEDAYEAVKAALMEGKSYMRTSWSEAELGHAEGLVRDKYGTHEWNYLL